MHVEMDMVDVTHFLIDEDTVVNKKDEDRWDICGELVKRIAG